VRRLSAFGQDLYPEAAACLARLALADPIPTRRELREALAAELPQRSPSTKRRLADKLLQRFASFDEEGRVQRTPLLRLLAGAADPRTRAHLTYYRTAAVENVLGALAEEMLFPYLVNGRPPEGMGRTQFRVANASDLFESDRAVTRRLISAYARSVWRFSSESTLTRALRMMRQVGIIEGMDRQVMGRRLTCFVRVPIRVAPITLAYALHEEFGAGRSVRVDRVQSGRAARRFLLEPIQTLAVLQELRREGLVGLRRRGAHGYLTFPDAPPDEFASRLIESGLT